MFEPSIMEILQQRLGDKIDDFLLPPPVFELMHGEFLSIDVKTGRITTRFPVLAEFQNPYGSMQGGMVAAAVDNTIGPLSMMVAPLNVTRRLEMKYNHPITDDIEYITVEGKFVEREGRKLTFNADVRDQNGRLLARGHAFHWIIAEDQKL
jgi:acyl-coenzyme A thioesterase PaaI-like protein